MAKFGRCSEPSCADVDVRLFDCAHHCLNTVCLQHLIEHDQWLECNKRYLTSLHADLKQCWTTYLSLVDETKLHLEFEQKLQTFRQLSKDVTNLCHDDSMSLDDHRALLNQLERRIEEERRQSAVLPECLPRLEQIKPEASEELPSNHELGRSFHALRPSSPVILAPRSIESEYFRS